MSDPSSQGSQADQFVRGATDPTIIKRNLSIGLLIACPLILALPPRKLDFYTVSLAASTFFSANHLLKYNTGRSALNRIGINAALTEQEGDLGGMPTERARQYQKMLRERKAAVGKDDDRGTLEKIWRGHEGEDWREKRAEREREVLQQGDGVSTLISEYFAEAFGRNKDGSEKDDEEGKENRDNNSTP